MLSIIFNIIVVVLETGTYFSLRCFKEQGGDSRFSFLLL